MKYVLTGGPGVGKTTVINILVEKGFEVRIIPRDKIPLIVKG